MKIDELNQFIQTLSDWEEDATAALQNPTTPDWGKEKAERVIKGCRYLKSALGDAINGDGGRSEQAVTARGGGDGFEFSVHREIIDDMSGE